MKKSTKLLGLTAAVALLARSARPWPRTSRSASSLDFTGPLAGFRPRMVDGRNLAIKNVNDQGGILGGKMLDLRRRRRRL